MTSPFWSTANYFYNDKIFKKNGTTWIIKFKKFYNKYKLYIRKLFRGNNLENLKKTMNQKIFRKYLQWKFRRVGDKINT